ncbi:hypothetical protein E2562_020107 [Oryza meyeriana var. granulata]|uniref:F-box domain-containing protein n=1 Tax=Oryza meyeriana var. granulata TaxID=110450 RepID=A0A6G1ECZ8_9ORYZ|nr:hypothetical protein E2562_020107 [Oryza meyeriana var. granulata]
MCNILPRLPFPLLVRLAAVRRSWRDLILHDPAFAAQQARTPSPASVSAAVFRHGRIQLLAGYAAVGPPDPELSFLPFRGLILCSCTGGLLCFSARPQSGSGHTFVVVNPATREFCSVPFDDDEKDQHGQVTAGLAYDPATAASDSFHLVVASLDDAAYRFRFRRFSSRDASTAWRASRDTLLLPRGSLLEGPRTSVYWIVSSGDVAEDRAGTLPLPPAQWRPNIDTAGAPCGRSAVASGWRAPALSVWGCGSSPAAGRSQCGGRRCTGGGTTRCPA